MRFSWSYPDDQPQLLRRFIRRLGISRTYLKWIKYEGGQILVNGQPVTVRYQIQSGDCLTIVPPLEVEAELAVDSTPLDLVYEDDHLLVVDKPAGVLSIPTKEEASATMVNRIKGYYVRQGYENQVVHIVTRLDRDTSGLMLVAKHRLAKSFLGRQMEDRQIVRQYLALSHRREWPNHGLIDAPIARSVDSIVTRRVDPTGQPAQTEYWLEASYAESALLRLELHTGRTHQIRVHLKDAGGVLVGDDLYGAPDNELLKRQGLHCTRLSFQHPWTQETLTLDSPLPADMQAWIDWESK